MAELVAELVAEPFISFVVEQLIQESKLLHGVGGQVEQMQKELSTMKSYLKDADARREEENNLVSNWISEIRELSLDAEDVIATFVIKVANMRRGRIHHMLNIFSELKARHKVGWEILDINEKIKDLTRRLHTYGIQPASANALRELRQSYPHVVEEDIVGLDEDVKIVVGLLVNKVSTCRVVSICGMGGLGKTTLAKKVYHHEDVKRHFDRFAWAYISQQCKTREVLESILIKLISPISPEERKEIEHLKFDELAEKLYRVQSDKKCLVILDDIWKCEDWDGLFPGFPTTETVVGSKILLTTRKQEVGFHVDQQCVLHELRHLTEEESWELFQKKVSPRRKEFNLSPEMTVLGRKMVEHCGGLPLAIVVLGGLLANKPMLGEWENVSRNVEDYIRKGKRQGGVPVESVLELSYNDLPYHLKACFLCLSDLPEDEGIRPIKLVQRWMAEGFVSLPERAQIEAKNETLLDVGMSYLDELRQRCMIQVDQLTRYSRRVKFYRLHDLMRDLCMLKAKKENFLKFVFMGEDTATGTSSLSSSTTIRRLSVYRKADQTASDSGRKGYVKPLSVDKTFNLHHVRACQFYFFDEKLEDSGWQYVKAIFKGFKLIRYLDLENLSFSNFREKMMPKALGNLIHLRYLSIRDSRIAGLPSSIGNLRFLETLDLRSFWRIRIPNVLWRLEQLRHLYLPGRRVKRRHSQSKLRLDGLYNLETLEGFRSDVFDTRIISTLTNLRKLGIEVDSPKELAVILESPSLSNSSGLLKNSSFIIHGSYQTQEEQSLLRQVLRYHHLHKLYLYGFLTELPNSFPPSLTHLMLDVAELNEDPMPILEKLPNLKRLKLSGKRIKKMVCTAGGFPQLMYLELYKNEDLEEWRVEPGAMPSLSELMIDECGKLNRIPDGLRFVTTLRQLTIYSPSQELRDRLREGGEDFLKFQHVHSIKFYTSSLFPVLDW